jgi:hypothetical protein
MAANQNDPLRPLLIDSEQELQVRVQEVCREPRVSKETTAELIRLEETLTMAAEAAKQTISLRRRIRQRQDVTDEQIRPEAST